ncbi:hypothetical protein [Microbulbifer agarilyticus]|uniref:hypothetical protein n=1 Tax=Microbulbifer agarilyticus TaxID=260552 RepID=UPI001CD7A12A|nr:hypothetical protein [Microbulbifer agarilyticus]MCA0893855.1 hypothetical protein [Microbulbifer agarilyticus]
MKKCSLRALALSVMTLSSIADSRTIEVFDYEMNTVGVHAQMFVECSLLAKEATFHMDPDRSKRLSYSISREFKELARTQMNFVDDLFEEKYLEMALQFEEFKPTSDVTNWATNRYRKNCF